jgi:hypothetical protein
LHNRYRKELKSLKHQVPDFLQEVRREAYARWLERKAAALDIRDRNRGNTTAPPALYRVAIHKAVERSGGRDAYTGERPDWSLLSTYSIVELGAGKRRYKARFALLPTVNHVGDGIGEADFEICAWQTNDAKSDLSIRI